MAQPSAGSGANQVGLASQPLLMSKRPSQLGGMLVLAGLLGGAHVLNMAPDQGFKAAFSLLLGALLGITFQQGRFCFFCILRDFFEKRNSNGLFAILAALAVGGIGYAVVFGMFLPNTFTGRLPPEAHIGPVSWVTAAAGLAFGLGMALSGACISGHLYRLGEGYTRAPIALVGALVGFALGFFTWQSLYLEAIRTAPVAWLPASLGYGGALLLHLVVLAVLAIFLLRWVSISSSRPSTPPTLYSIWATLIRTRWNPLITGSLVGLIGVVAYLRVEPLGVTSQLGSLARTSLDNMGLLSGRLNGLDAFSGCATQVVQVITNNGWVILGVALGSFGVVLLGSRFKLSRLTLKNSATAFGGGILMGWGSMLALGCTVGTLLSGISAFAVAGWVFAAAVFFGVWLGIKLRLHTTG
jgi:uncharacterized protein